MCCVQEGKTRQKPKWDYQGNVQCRHWDAGNESGTRHSNGRTFEQRAYISKIKRKALVANNNPGILRDTVGHVKCVRRQLDKDWKHPSHQCPSITGEPFERIAMDLIGPLPRTRKGTCNQWIRDLIFGGLPQCRLSLCNNRDMPIIVV